MVNEILELKRRAGILTEADLVPYSEPQSGEFERAFETRWLKKLWAFENQLAQQFAGEVLEKLQGVLEPELIQMIQQHEEFETSIHSAIRNGWETDRMAEQIVLQKNHIARYGYEPGEFYELPPEHEPE